MSAFTLPVTVRHGDRIVRLLVRLAGPLPWSAVRAEVCRAAGLDASAVLYQGAGAVEDTWLVGSPPLLAGCVLTTAPDDAAYSRDPLLLAVVGGPDAGRCVPVTSAAMLIGRSHAADLRLTDPAVSWRHATMTPAPNGLAVADLGSTNGVRIDGVLVAGSAPAVTGSVIRVGDSVLQIQLAAEPPGSFRADGHGHAIRAGVGLRAAPVPPSIPPRPTRPEPPPRRSLPLVAALIGAALGTVLAIAVHNPLYLAFAALGPATLLASALSDRVRGRRSMRRRLRDFRAATAQWEHAARAASAAIRRRAWQDWPGPAELLRRAESGSARLWMRQPDGAPTASVGVAARTVPDITGHPPAAGADPETDPPLSVPDVPMPIALDGVIGFVGATGRGVARYVLAQLACCFAPSDVALLVLTDRDDLAACRDLPHAISAAELHAERPGEPGPRTVVVLDGAEAMLGSGAATALRAAGPAVTVLCLAQSRRELPPQAIDTVAAAVAVGTTPTAMSGPLLRRVCRALAPLRDRSPGATAPPELDLTELTGPIDADRVGRQWRAGVARAVLGAGAEGAIGFDLDTDGPHLLIAGTTGSGKSELLQTFVASMAVAASPQAVTFLLVDYKGGAAFGAITDLPHVVGVLTDLDSTGSARALASLRAELRRRERLNSAGAARPAKLVVVIDEFATLAAELPEFLAGMLDIAQRGRSLGLHLVVATQRPAGVVSPAMRANIGARICLRVTDPAESIDVIGIADAAALPPGRPGRALARLRGTVAPFQVARVSGPVPPEVAVTVVPNAAGTAAVDITPSTGPALRPPATILSAIIDATRAAADGMPPIDRPWLPPLPSHVSAAQSAPSTVAVADQPDRQRRCELTAPTMSTLILGPPQSGRSTALRRIATVAARAHHELIVIDGGDHLAGLARWPAVSTYLTSREPRLVLRALALLADPARRPRDGHLRHVVIDHLDLVAAELERTDVGTGATLLTELLTRDAGSVRLTASGPHHLRHQRIAAGFREVIELGGAASGSIPGRGSWTGQQIQIVDAPAGSDCPDQSTGPGQDTIVVRPLPVAVMLSQLPAPTAAAVPFAVGGDAALPVVVDLTGPGGGIVIAGPRRSGVTTALRVLAGQAARAGIPVLWASARAGLPADLPGVTNIPCHRGTDALAAALHEHRGPLVLAADHGEAGEEHPAAALFERFLAVCGPGQHLLIGVPVDVLMRTRRGHLHAAASGRRGALLSPDQAHGPLLDIRLPKRSGSVTAGRGVWTWDGSSYPVQFPSSVSALPDAPRMPDTACEEAHLPDC